MCGTPVMMTAGAFPDEAAGPLCRECSRATATIGVSPGVPRNRAVGVGDRVGCEPARPAAHFAVRFHAMKVILIDSTHPGLLVDDAPEPPETLRLNYKNDNGAWTDATCTRRWMAGGRCS